MNSFRSPYAALLIAFTSLATASLPASISDSGYLKMTNTPSISFGFSYAPRFLWDPGKQHIQAGSWLPSHTQVGTHSVAIGNEVVSGGYASLAFGDYSSSPGMYSFAFGASALATGTRSPQPIARHVPAIYGINARISFFLLSEYPSGRANEKTSPLQSGVPASPDFRSVRIANFNR